jgi:hypothetical protein
MRGDFFVENVRFLGWRNVRIFESFFEMGNVRIFGGEMREL